MDRHRQRGADVQRLPIVKPPWRRITAIDLNTGDTAWQIRQRGHAARCEEPPAAQGRHDSEDREPGRAPLLVTKTLLFAG